MKHSQAQLNRIWSHVLLEELTRVGVRQVCVAPGSRSTPLTLEADANSKLTLHRHFDERGLGFLALGLAKASHRPVAIIVTSGTAVANLLPAVVEANLTGEPLILLTSDRPQELVGCGANQAIYQPGIFSNHVTSALNLPSPCDALSLSWLLTSIDELVSCQQKHGGVLHINCPFPEPLYTQDIIDYAGFYNASVSAWAKSTTPYVLNKNTTDRSRVAYEFTGLDFQALSQRKGLFILGQLDLADAEAALKLTQKLGWPVLCDPQSGVTSEWGHYDLWLQHEKFAQALKSCDCIVQVGSRLVSKRLHTWLTNQVSDMTAEYFYVSPSRQRDNPHHLPQTQVVTQVRKWTESWGSAISSATPSHQGWANELAHHLVAVEQHLNRYNLDDPISEISLAKCVNTLSSNADLFIGNSLVIRMLDMFAKLDRRNTFSNRGASGIDGLVATAVGVQKSRTQALIMLIGDTSLLYDLNSLALVAKQTQPFILIVINNDGGAIFDLLPVPDQKKTELYQMPHGLEFRHVSAQFGLSYVTPSTPRHLIDAVTQHVDHGTGGLVVEVVTANQPFPTLIKQQVNEIYAL